ncbi:MAG: N-acetyltransferase [Burkholderiales bacterium]|nr:N-acetyltransferase [Burkholderiales bacterium]
MIASMESLTNNEAMGRYELAIDGQLAAIAQYEADSAAVKFVHTEVMPAFEGKGVGSRLARQVLDDVRRRGDRAIMQCPFMAGYVRKHPEYADLLAG